MLSKKIKTAEKSKSSMNTSMNPNKKLTVVKGSNERTAAYSPDYQLYNDDCNLNYWGAGFMGKDFMF